MKIRLRENMFSDREQLFLEDGELKAYLFRFESGVCGIKLENSLGYITVLPYQGQMVWDAVFRGRSLKMQNSCHFPRFRKEFRNGKENQKRQPGRKGSPGARPFFRAVFMIIGCGQAAACRIRFSRSRG